MPRELAPVVYYTLEVRALQNVLRRVNRDTRPTPDEFKRVAAAINEITRILSDVQTRPLP